jgi:integrase
MNENGHLPAGITRIVSEKTGRVTFEAGPGTVFGKRIRKWFGEDAFGSELAALAAANSWLKEKKREIREDRKLVVSISDRERLSYLEAMRLLEPYDKTVLEAVQDAIKSYKGATVAEKLSFQEAAVRYRIHKKQENCRESYLNDIKSRFGAMAEFDEDPVGKITHKEIIEFLEDREISEVTWNNWRRDLGCFFKFCLLNQWIVKNPIDLVPTKKVDEEEVEILEVHEVRTLLSHAKRVCPRQIPWLVLSLFCGLRRSEADAVEWSDINLLTNTVKVKAAKLRSVSTRYVELTEPARAFLDELPRNEPFATGKYARRNDFKILSRVSGIDCSKNIYRHSFGSYYLAQCQNTQKTMIQMGHDNQQTFVRFYRKPIPKVIAEAYWMVTPSSLLLEGSHERSGSVAA